MSEIEDYYNNELSRLRKSCGVYDRENFKCKGKRCICAAIAECIAYQKKILPSGFSELELSNFTGIVDGNRTVNSHAVKTALSKILDYCFGDSNISTSSSRYDLHKSSKMDERFKSGHNFIIYGNSISVGKHKVGKTMLASLIMKEAIWRRMFKENQAYTYLFKSCSELIDEIISKKYNDQNINSLNADWLCIDDIFVKNRPGQASALDQILSVRSRQTLPTICIVQFDPYKMTNVEEIVGNHLVKMLTDKTNSYVLSLS
jgi:DNA replication protein DnaC